jgi:hypothetical protein
VETHTCGRGLLRGWWWPVGPKLEVDQLAAPVPETMDTPSCLASAWIILQIWSWLFCFLHSSLFTNLYYSELYSLV